jgi:hypothetical protein
MLSRYVSFYTQLTHTDLLIFPEKLEKKYAAFLRPNFLTTLGLQSKIPVMMLRSDQDSPSRFNNLLFAMNDPMKCEQGFRNTVEFARLSGAKLTLIFKPFGMSDLRHTGVELFGNVPFLDPSLFSDTTTKIDALSEWVTYAKSRGVDTKLKTDQTGRDLLTVLREAQKENGNDLIAVDPSLLEAKESEKIVLKLSKERGIPIWVSHRIGQSAASEYLHQMQTRLA